MTSETRSAEIRREYEETHGEWTGELQAVLDLDPEFLAAYSRLEGVPARTRVLPEKLQHLIRLAVAANATHLYIKPVRGHIRRALDAGATPAEVMEVLECCATLGIHAMNIGVPILAEVLEEAGVRTGPAELDEYQQRLKAEFTEKRGYWHEFWNEILELAPEFFDAYTEFSSVPWVSGTLDPKVKEFIYIAFDTSATHLYTKGLRLHLENAVRYGATAAELIEVMEIAATLGMHGVLEAAPILAEEMRRAR
ncbi:carboxymuconolactone decarboxylase family protein [Agromyces aerolatus]|uniref:carboxymuconolactone decarboxylase family protein n=1 Tax=Agromyces sp. LY-1074 TaxID=3074080 RepID=UPI0028592FAB|nr:MULTISPECIES: carboxymuconolactone decarboxylase family protein [unclassified Agromyces]MDR5698700.1 carboxymuconolactone decarboxylase family protein [Agromyces sp. LY-1074]MDR5704994.1 carboxymuconolactone decarboxylase family protein [Agromyces sp. LY-1358]